MKKLWSYIAAFTLGIVGGMIAMFQLTKGSINKTEITTKRIVQRRNINSSQDVSNSITKSESRRERKENKKLDKALKRANK